MGVFVGRLLIKVQANQMMTPEEYNSLYHKFLDGTCTDEERKRLLEYRSDIDIQRFDDSEEIAGQQRIKAEIYDRLSEAMAVKKTKRLFPWKYVAAACLCLIVGITVQQRFQKPAAGVRAPKQLAVNDKLPVGGNRATLTLGDGKEIDLTTLVNGRVYEIAGIKISKTSSGKISYRLATGSQDTTPVYHTIRTPRGGEYEVVLPDGTQVWLNAATTLRFPSKFIGGSRKVDLIGEAYFEVAKNKDMPFSVYAKNTEVRVLGTHFNVMAYPEELTTATTLVEGAVQLRTANSSKTLSPGEQGQVDQRAVIQTDKVNVEDVIAWQKGYFVFRKEKIKSIMAKVARWYGADIVYQGDLDDVKLGGTVSRAEHIGDLLARLEMTGAINFKIEGKTIYVIKAKNP